MIAELKKSPTLDDVLNYLASLPAQPDASQLQAFLNAYPQFADEIVDFATDLVAMDSQPAPLPASEDEANLIVDRTMSRIRQMMFDRSRAEKLSDLYADITASGHDQVSFEKAVGIDRSILDCLINRWIDRKTLPKRLITDMASALGRQIETVRDYFRLPPVPAPAYRSRAKPVVKQPSFSIVVGQSNLAESEKRRWLDEVPDDLME